MSRAGSGTRADDLRVLEILDRYERQGQTSGRIARDLRVTRNVVVGVAHRARQDAAEAVCTCTRPENRDGGMPPRWWAA